MLTDMVYCWEKRDSTKTTSYSLWEWNHNAWWSCLFSIATKQV